MGEKWQLPKCTESPYLPVDYYGASEEMRQELDWEKEWAWFNRRHRPVERYAAVEYQGRMSDFCTKMNQFAATAYQSVGRRKITIPFPGKLQELPAPALIESVEVILQIREPWQINPNVVYLKISYCNDTETIYTMSADGQYGTSPYNGLFKVPLPKNTPHVCRHTYCSNMALAGMNPKTLQYLMGHSDIGVTLNTYTHLKYDDAKEEVQKMTKNS